MSQVNKSLASHWWMFVIAAVFGSMMVGASVHTALAASAPEAQRNGEVAWTGDGDDNDRPRFRGLVEQMPEGGRIGEWRIGGRTVVANAQTQFDETEGAIGLGVCVKVEFVSQGSTTAREIDSEPLSDCNGGGDDDDDGAEIYGIVEAMPAGGTVGAWTVSGSVYTVTAQTELKTEYGAFDIGRCVKIHLMAGSTNTVREMETERGFKCSGGDDNTPPPAGVIGRGELYGELKSFPQELVGVWEIGVLTFTATTNTEFKTANGPFTVGEIVKVEFYVMQDGTFLAREIKTAMANWGGDDDDDDHGGDRQKGHAFGVVEQLPAEGLFGVWTVGGVSYSVTNNTELRARGGSFAVGVTVKIEFRVDGNGNRIAKEIKLMFPQGAPGNTEATFVGFIDAMPPTGYVGQWVVNGVEFTANAQSKFKEDHGALTVGAYVKVEYRLNNGVRMIHEMETAVPPGAGDDNFIGNVERMDDNVIAAALTDSVWVIGGRTFVVTPSTRVDGALNLSDTAWVNSYTTTSGEQVATRIQGLTLNNFVYLPMTRR